MFLIARAGGREALSLSTVECIVLLTLWFIILSCLGRCNKRPSHNILLNRSIVHAIRLHVSEVLCYGAVSAHTTCVLRPSPTELNRTLAHLLQPSQGLLNKPLCLWNAVACMPQASRSCSAVVCVHCGYTVLLLVTGVGDRGPIIFLSLLLVCCVLVRLLNVRETTLSANNTNRKCFIYCDSWWTGVSHISWTEQWLYDWVPIWKRLFCFFTYRLNVLYALKTI